MSAAETVDVSARRHAPTDECDGMPLFMPRFFGSGVCAECRVRLCSCEWSYGHDCEGL